MKSRHNNQVRVVAPEQDARLRLIAEACIRSGLPDAFADILAEGYVARLRRRVYQAMKDEIGSGDDLEALCGWNGPPRVLAVAMAKANYVRDIHGVYVMTDAVNEAPEYLEKRWKRHDRAGYVAAVKRSAPPNVVHQQRANAMWDEERWMTDLEEDDMQQQHETLFGFSPEGPGETHVVSAATADKADRSAHHQIVQYWHQRYIEKDNASGYPWRKSDFKYVEWIIAALGAIHRVKRTLDAYLANRSAYYRGHELRKLYHNLAEFSGTDGPRRSPARSCLASSRV